MGRAGEGNVWLIVGLWAVALAVLAVLTVAAVRPPTLPIGLPPAVAQELQERIADGEIGEPVQLWRAWLARDGRIWYRLRVSAPGGARVWTHVVYEPTSEDVAWVDWLGGQ